MTDDILKQLRLTRQIMGLSQEALADALNNKGHGYLSMLESGKRGVKLNTLTKWADVLGYEVVLKEKR